MAGEKPVETKLHESLRLRCGPDWLRGEWYKEDIAFRLYRKFSPFAIAWIRVLDADGSPCWHYKRMARLTEAEAEAFLVDRVRGLGAEANRLAELLSYFGSKFPDFAGHVRAVCPEVDQYLMDFMGGDDTPEAVTA